MVEVIFVEHDTGRVDHLQPTLKLNRLELLRVTRLSSDGTDLRPLQGIDQAALTDVRISNNTDGDSLC